MRDGHASRTAMLVALWRAMGDLGVTSVPGFSDPASRHMLAGRAWQFLLDRTATVAANPDSQIRRSMIASLDMIVMRVAFIDAVLADRLASQVVILGAGLDTRAWRLPALSGVRVYELDHPATQGYKRERAARLAPPLAELQFVPIDFTRDTLGHVLSAVGFDASLPTLWVWEGVIMYLDDAALRSALAEIRRLSAPGSTLIAHYHEPSVGDPFEVVWRLMLSWLREPQIGLRRRDRVREELTRADFNVVEDAGLREQAARLGNQAPSNAALQISRIMVADC